MIYLIPTEKTKITTLNRTTFSKPKQGVECMFIKLNKKVGIKVFPTKKNAVFSYKKQRKASKYGVSPKVLSNVSRCLVDNLLRYDDENLFEINSMSLGEKQYGYFYETEVAYQVGGRYSKKEFGDLVAKFKSIHYCPADFHEDNLGRIKGKLVCIDFGKISS